MNVYSYEKICADLQAGQKHTVANEESKVMGEVTMCNHGYFNVHIGPGEEVWDSAACLEVTPGSEWKYRTDHATPIDHGPAKHD
ncbi:MAG: hypothetical protein OET90_11055 [Desulfuromonadales bacterium]|nr:hypothetical protein [Desulfuromonadales bacterium]